MDFSIILQIAILVVMIIIAMDINKLARAVGRRSGKYKNHPVKPSNADSGNPKPIASSLAESVEPNDSNDIDSTDQGKRRPSYINVVVLD